VLLNVSINNPSEADPLVIYDGAYLPLSEARRRLYGEIKDSTHADCYSPEQIENALLRAAQHTARLLEKLAVLPPEERATLEQDVLENWSRFWLGAHVGINAAGEDCLHLYFQPEPQKTPLGSSTKSERRFAILHRKNPKFHEWQADFVGHIILENRRI
jgi:hypothetical protein